MIGRYGWTDSSEESRSVIVPCLRMVAGGRLERGRGQSGWFTTQPRASRSSTAPTKAAKRERAETDNTDDAHGDSRGENPRTSLGA
jgi:hypothetical protein